MSITIECDECGRDDLRSIVCLKCYDEEKDKVTDLQKQVDDLEDDKERLEKKVDDQDQEITDLEAEVATLKVELAKKKEIDDILRAIDKVNDGMIEQAQLEKAEKNIGVPDEVDLQASIGREG